MRGFALSSPFWRDATQFSSKEEAETFLAEQEQLRGKPFTPDYFTVGTFADFILAYFGRLPQ